MKFREKLFQTKLLSRLSHKVRCLLSSPVLLRKFTTVKSPSQNTNRYVYGSTRPALNSFDSKLSNMDKWAYSFRVPLQCDYCNRGNLDKVDQSDYRKITIQSVKGKCHNIKRNNCMRLSILWTK